MLEFDELRTSILLYIAIASNNQSKGDSVKEVSSIVTTNVDAQKKEKELDPTRYIPKDPSLISYGAASTNLAGHLSEKYYLTTAIAYTNGYPHIGHAYEVYFLLNKKHIIHSMYKYIIY